MPLCFALLRASRGCGVQLLGLGRHVLRLGSAALHGDAQQGVAGLHIVPAFQDDSALRAETDGLHLQPGHTAHQPE